MCMGGGDGDGNYVSFGCVFFSDRARRRAVVRSVPASADLGPPPRVTALAGEERDDDVEEGHNAVDDRHDDAADAVDDRHDHATDGLEEVSDL